MIRYVFVQMKARNWKQASGTAGIEGEKNDEWQLVDCNNFLVHLLLPSKLFEISLAFSLHTLI